jgi:hypothetical protein
MRGSCDVEQRGQERILESAAERAAAHQERVEEHVAGIGRQDCHTDRSIVA